MLCSGTHAAAGLVVISDAIVRCTCVRTSDSRSSEPHLGVDDHGRVGYSSGHHCMAMSSLRVTRSGPRMALTNVRMFPPGVLIDRVTTHP
jgi:hypothetical protein